MCVWRIADNVFSSFNFRSPQSSLKTVHAKNEMNMTRTQFNLHIVWFVIIRLLYTFVYSTSNILSNNTVFDVKHVRIYFHLRVKMNKNSYIDAVRFTAYLILRTNTPTTVLHLSIPSYFPYNIVSLCSSSCGCNWHNYSGKYTIITLFMPTLFRNQWPVQDSLPYCN